MMYRYLTLDGPIVRLSDLATIPLDPLNSDYQTVLAWCDEGNTIEPPLPPSPEELEASTAGAVQRILDDFAKTRIYDDIKSATGYAGDEDPQFNLEGTYCKLMRSRYWRICYTILGQVQAGLRPLPTLEEVLKELPPLVWPTLPVS